MSKQAKPYTIQPVILRVILLTMLPAVFALLDCMSLPDAGSSVSGNGRITGRIQSLDGHPAQNTAVALFAGTYDPVRDAASFSISRDTTDSRGEYSFANVKSGTYNIEAVQLQERTRVLISGITVADDTVTASDDSLRKPGFIRVVLPDDIAAVNSYVYIPGTSIASNLNENALSVTLDSVPAGMITAVCFKERNSQAPPRVIANGVRVDPGDTTMVSAGAWRSVRKLRLNTAPSGAGVAGDVYHFPLLIRLTKGNFDFSTARAHGEDIRFAKPDNTPLACEIERWDPVNGLAEVWVKVDTVRGNDSSQSLFMYWGNDTAAGNSNGAAVFDTADGFEGVWHLGETGNSIARDATGNHYDGTPSDTAPTGAPGAIGPCRSFNGSSNYLRMNGTANSKLNFQENGIYTISAWAYADTLDYGFHLVVGKGNEQYFLKFKNTNPGIPNSSMVWEFVEYYDKVGYSITNCLPSGKVWTHLVGVRNGPVQHFYVNGELVDSTAGISAFNVPRNTGEDVSIGKYLSMPADTTGGKCPFLGMIDEVRISSVACGADWIKLCYMNQKEQDALVKW